MGCVLTIINTDVLIYACTVGMSNCHSGLGQQHDDILMKGRGKTPLDYIAAREELVPVQVRLPKTLLASVKAKLEQNGMTFTDLVKGACAWYLNVSEAEAQSMTGTPKKTR